MGNCLILRDYFKRGNVSLVFAYEKKGQGFIVKSEIYLVLFDMHLYICEYQTRDNLGLPSVRQFQQKK